MFDIKKVIKMEMQDVAEILAENVVMDNLHFYSEISGETRKIGRTVAFLLSSMEPKDFGAFINMFSNHIEQITKRTNYNVALAATTWNELSNYPNYVKSAIAYMERRNV